VIENRINKYEPLLRKLLGVSEEEGQILGFIIYKGGFVENKTLPELDLYANQVIEAVEGLVKRGMVWEHTELNPVRLALTHQLDVKGLELTLEETWTNKKKAKAMLERLMEVEPRIAMREVFREQLEALLGDYNNAGLLAEILTTVYVDQERAGESILFNQFYKKKVQKDKHYPYSKGEVRQFINSHHRLLVPLEKGKHRAKIRPRFDITTMITYLFQEAELQYGDYQRRLQELIKKYMANYTGLFPRFPIAYLRDIRYRVRACLGACDEIQILENGACAQRNEGITPLDILGESETYQAERHTVRVLATRDVDVPAKIKSQTKIQQMEQETLLEDYRGKDSVLFVKEGRAFGLLMLLNEGAPANGLYNITPYRVNDAAREFENHWREDNE
jgi:hypothetical protein